jgi:hypothetical protein
MQSHLIIVNSSHRESGDHNNFTVVFNNNNLNQVKHVSLVASRFLNSQYNITINNNVFEYTVDATLYRVIVPPGQYTYTDLEQYFIVSVPTITISLIPITNKIQFVTTGAALTIHASSSTIRRVLGISTEDIVSATNTIVADMIPDLSGLSMIHVSSQELAHNNSIVSDNSHGSIISSIPIMAGGFGLPIVYESNTDDQSDNLSFKTPQNLNRLTIQLLDHNHELARLQTPVMLIFKIFK